IPLLQEGHSSTIISFFTVKKALPYSNLLRITLFLPSFKAGLWRIFNLYTNMSIIQTIRDKYARLAVIAVAVALVGFILIDYISGRGRSLFNGGSITLGSVNGQKIDELEFEKKV